MSKNIFATVDSGCKVYRSRFNLSYRHTTNCDYGALIPIMAKFCLPGDVWKCGANILARYQPMYAPTFTRSWIKMRYFFVPLRLIEPDFETVVTGSKNGKLVSSVPVLKDFLADVRKEYQIVKKYSFWDYLGIPCMDYSKLTDADKSFLPASYWAKAYARIHFDYFRDENLAGYSEFEDSYVTDASSGYYFKSLDYSMLPKDYFTSALPWQLKGVAPTFSVTPSGHAEFSDAVVDSRYTYNLVPESTLNLYRIDNDWVIGPGPGVNAAKENAIYLENALKNNELKINDISFNASDLRTMFAQTRVFERLARCGSRYTEYLRSNFNVAPSDGTLQRAQYLGGFKQPIVCTEIPQTAQDGNTAVGTLRGKGISSGSGSIKPYVVKEFGVIFGILNVMPEISYSQGIPREYTYKERFDFFNPSFQNLSEQEVRNGELYVGRDGKNSEPFGYQGYYNELRISHNINTAEMRDTLAYWNQGVYFAARPNLSTNFISSRFYNDSNSFHKPFAVQSEPPVIIDCMNLLDVYRPMVRRPVPGLIDHN